MKYSVGYILFMCAAMIYALWTWIDYSADEQAALINEAVGREVACTTWLVSYPGRIVVACEEK